MVAAEASGGQAGGQAAVLSGLPGRPQCQDKAGRRQGKWVPVQAQEDEKHPKEDEKHRK
jgi:hypothetical protein